MQEQLRNVRAKGWTYAGIFPLREDSAGELGSVNERRACEALRFADDLLALEVKPCSIDWVDWRGVERKYSPDAKGTHLSGDKILLEIKPHGWLERMPLQRAKYEDIGRYLQSRGNVRFGIVEWDWESTLSRNISRLSAYWDTEPGHYAVDAFDEIGGAEVALGDIFDRVRKDSWPAVWAAIASQHLTADLTRGRVNRDTMVSMPGVVYEAVGLGTLVTSWLA